MSQEFSPRLLRTLIVAEVKKGPATRTDLHRRLRADEQLMREILNALVSEETLAIVQAVMFYRKTHRLFPISRNDMLQQR